MTALIEATGVIKHFPVKEGGILHRRTIPLRAVDHVDLSIQAGETIGLVGESGCGKSTLGRLLIRLIPATAGRILFDGTDILSLDAAALRRARRAMQIIFQDPYGALNPRMTVADIVAEPLVIQGATHAARRAGVSEMLDRVGLPVRARDRFPHEFSGGQRQRIGIARALITRPKFVVCDEPVSALDVSVQAQIVNLLVDLRAELGLTYLFIAHDLAVVKHIANRIAVMYLGKIVELAGGEALHAAPRHPYTRALIASVPAMHPSRRARSQAPGPTGPGGTAPRDAVARDWVTRDSAPPDLVPGDTAAGESGFRGQGSRLETRRLAGDIPSALHPPPGCRFHTRCPLAIDVCRVVEPPMTQPAAGHYVACHVEG